MIRVHPQPKPLFFDAQVHQPCQAFLQALGRTPTTNDWERHAYWQKCLPDLYADYGGICAYSSHWIPPDGLRSVDHFIPKSSDQSMAYSWDNFRLASHLMNSRKHTHRDVLDPFTIPQNAFCVDFDTLKIKPSRQLLPRLFQRADKTINRLKLNDPRCIDARIAWLEPYAKAECKFVHLQHRAPFLAYEITRQHVSRPRLRELFRRPSP